MKFDVFISHSSEEKSSIARPLANCLRSRGLSVWLDEHQLKVGDGLRENIDNGIRDSRYGVVILSPSFIDKPWTRRELDGLFIKEEKAGKVILPIWHNVTREDVENFSPILADKIAISSSDGNSKICEKIFEVISGERNHSNQFDSHLPDSRKFSQLFLSTLGVIYKHASRAYANFDVILAKLLAVAVSPLIFIFKNSMVLIYAFLILLIYLIDLDDIRTLAGSTQSSNVQSTDNKQRHSIGVLLPVGPLEGFQASIENGIEAAVKRVNKESTDITFNIKKYHIEIGNTQGVALEIARALNADHVDAIVTLTTQDTIIAADINREHAAVLSLLADNINFLWNNKYKNNLIFFSEALESLNQLAESVRVQCNKPSIIYDGSLKDSASYGNILARNISVSHKGEVLKYPEKDSDGKLRASLFSATQANSDCMVFAQYIFNDSSYKSIADFSSGVKLFFVSKPPKLMLDEFKKNKARVVYLEPASLPEAGFEFSRPFNMSSNEVYARAYNAVMLTYLSLKNRASSDVTIYEEIVKTREYELLGGSYILSDNTLLKKGRNYVSK